MVRMDLAAEARAGGGDPAGAQREGVRLPGIGGSFRQGLQGGGIGQLLPDGGERLPEAEQALLRGDSAAVPGRRGFPARPPSAGAGRGERGDRPSRGGGRGTFRHQAETELFAEGDDVGCRRGVRRTAWLAQVREKSVCIFRRLAGCGQGADRGFAETRNGGNQAGSGSGSAGMSDPSITPALTSSVTPTLTSSGA